MLDCWLTPALEPHRQQVTLIGHRVLHGGERFTAPTRITAEVEATGELIPLAPLHNPPALKGLAWARQWAPELPQWAGFDTAFHSSLPAAAYTYAIPSDFRNKGFRRFGFHGINHQHVSETVAAQWLKQGKDPSQLRLISAHLGAGASLAAVKGGRCIDTTMGYTPLEGLVMATRSGNVDPGLLLELMREGYSEDEMARSCRRRQAYRDCPASAVTCVKSVKLRSTGITVPSAPWMCFATGCCKCSVPWPPASAVSTCWP